LSAAKLAGTARTAMANINAREFLTREFMKGLSFVLVMTTWV
jgi:hypothetical protein